LEVPAPSGTGNFEEFPASGITPPSHTPEPPPNYTTNPTNAG